MLDHLRTLVKASLDAQDAGMPNLRRLLPEWLGPGNFLSCRLIDFDGRSSHIGCLFKQGHRTLDRPAPWTIHHYPPGDRPSGSGVVGLSLALEGTAHLTDAAGRKREIRGGNLFQVRSGERGNAPSLQPQEGFSEFSVFFEPRLAEALLSMGVLDANFEIANTDPSAGLIGAYVDLLRLMENHATPGSAVLRRSISLLDQAYDLARGATPTDDMIVRACQLLAAHPEPSHTARDVATTLGVEYETFRRRFRHRMGIGPGEYQLQQRVDQAIRFLRTKTVKETCDLLGYTDVAFFSRQFKAVVGMSPKHFRPPATSSASGG